MKIEIDQSWKLEFTNKRTVLADSVGNAFIISAKDKRYLQKLFRNMQKRKKYVDQTFAVMLALLIEKTFSKDNRYIIDIEYPGHMLTIRDYTIQFLYCLGIEISKDQFEFGSITKRSLAHQYAIQTFKSKNKNIQKYKIKISHILKLLFLQ